MGILKKSKPIHTKNKNRELSTLTCQEVEEWAEGMVQWLGTHDTLLEDLRPHQAPITQTQGNPTPFFGLCGHSHKCVHTHTRHIIKINF